VLLGGREVTRVSDSISSKRFGNRCERIEAHLETQPSWGDPTPVGFAAFAHAKCAFFRLASNKRMVAVDSSAMQESKASTLRRHRLVCRHERRLQYSYNNVNRYFALFNYRKIKVKAGFWRLKKKANGSFSGIFGLLFQIHSR
jgi:hypothetical protein